MSVIVLDDLADTGKARLAYQAIGRRSAIANPQAEIEKIGSDGPGGFGGDAGPLCGGDRRGLVT